VNDHGNTELAETCSLDVVDDYPQGLERTDVSRIAGLSEREARDAERSGLVKLRLPLAAFEAAASALCDVLPDDLGCEEGGS
jgi:hypothetical protein